MSGLRWADSSDESEEEDFDIIPQQTVLNDGFIGTFSVAPQEEQGNAISGIGRVAVAGFSSDDESEESSVESKSTSDAESVEKEKKNQDGAKNTAKQEDFDKKKKTGKKPLSKKERQEIKAKEDDDFETLLEEFYVKTDTKNGNVAENITQEKQTLHENGNQPSSLAGAAPKRKKKRSKKKTGNEVSDVPNGAAAAETTEEPYTINVAEVVRKKTKPKEKSVKELAAATAAKEAKAKKEKVKTANKKKKKKDKYAHGAPVR